jgi:murein DD-endopeptidase MepM/ murein hydrolase activator NlpD
MKSTLKRRVFPFVVLAAFFGSGCGADAPVVWPISAETKTDFPLSSTFGPRIHAETGVYDFHRGIDIAVPSGTDIHAIAAGKVVQIEQNTSAGGMLVQVEHAGYFSNYIHASSVEVEVGAEVEPGDVIATSGKATNGFEHLHFEIRRPADTKDNCVHPLNILPYDDRSAPTLTLGAVDTTSPTIPKVTAKIEIPATEVDLKRVSVKTYDGSKFLSEQAYDIEEWNHTWTIDSSDAIVDDPNHDGVLVRPQKFNNTIGTWTIEFTFTKLVGPADPANLKVHVEAVDVYSHSASVDSP